MHRPRLKAALLLASVIGALATASCWAPCNGGSCAPPKFYDLVLTESDSGKAGISLGAWVAFALDTRRDRLTASPQLTVSKDTDSLNRFPGKRLFVIDPSQWGVFDVTASGGALGAFTFRLVVGHHMDRPAYGEWQPQDILVQQWGGGCGDRPLPALARPAFDLVQDQTKVSTSLAPADLQFAITRRAYRVLELRGWPVMPARPPYVGPCLPDGFPRYPLMTSMGGQSATCNWEMSANDSQANALAFYESELNRGDWRIASMKGPTIEFTRLSSGQNDGTLTVDPNGLVRVYVEWGVPYSCFRSGPSDSPLRPSPSFQVRFRLPVV